MKTLAIALFIPALAFAQGSTVRNPNYWRSCTDTVTTNCNPRVGDTALTNGTMPKVGGDGKLADSPISDDGSTVTVTGRTVEIGPTLSGWSQGGTVPTWQKVTKTFEDAAFLAAASAVSIELGTLPASTVVHAIRLKHGTAFAGTGITSMTCSVGDGTTHDLFLAAVDVFAAVGNTALGIDGGASQPTIAAQTLTLRCTANTDVGDGAATVLTAGSLTVHVLTSALVE